MIIIHEYQIFLSSVFANVHVYYLIITRVVRKVRGKVSERTISAISAKLFRFKIDVFSNRYVIIYYFFNALMHYKNIQLNYYDKISFTELCRFFLYLYAFFLTRKLYRLSSYNCMIFLMTSQ